MKKNLKKILIGLGLFLVVGLLFKVLFLNNTFLYAGTLEATKVDLSARLAAVIDVISVQEGDKVIKDQILVKLGCEDYKIANRLAHQNYERYRALLEKGWTTPERVDELKTEQDDSDMKVSWCTIYSPIDGTVLSRYHEPGEWMTPGTKILTLANIRDIWTYIYVPQPVVSKLSVGMKLKGYIPELNKQMFEGSIIKINDEAEFTPKNVQTRTERERLVYGIKISFLAANAQEILKPGMTIEVELP